LRSLLIGRAVSLAPAAQAFVECLARQTEKASGDALITLGTPQRFVDEA